MYIYIYIYICMYVYIYRHICKHYLPRREFALNKANKGMLWYARVSFIASVFNILRFKKNPE